MDVDYEKVKKTITGPCVLGMIPFKSNSFELNLEALKENIQYVIEAGIRRGQGCLIIPCGTGEYVTLSPEEHKLVLKTVLEVAGDRLPIVAGVSGCDYREVIKLARSSAEAGVDCVMVPPPYYYAMSQPDLYRWYKIITSGVKIGIMTYSQGWKSSGLDISVSLVRKLADFENVVSLKTGEGLLADYLEMLEDFSKRFAIIDNSTGQTSTLAHIHGAAGFITGPGVFWPELEAQYWSLLEQRKYLEAARLHQRLGPFWQFYYHGGGLIKGEEFVGAGEGAFFGASPFKATQEYVGLYGGPVRPPFTELTQQQKSELFSILQKIGVKRLEKVTPGRK